MKSLPKICCIFLVLVFSIDSLATNEVFSMRDARGKNIGTVTLNYSGGYIYTIKGFTFEDHFRKSWLTRETFETPARVQQRFDSIFQNAINQQLWQETPSWKYSHTWEGKMIFNGLPWDGKFEASLQSLVVTRPGDARWFLVLMATPNYTGNVYELRVNLVPETKV